MNIILDLTEWSYCGLTSGWVLTISGLLGAVLLLVYRYEKAHPQDFWTRHRLPGFKPIPVLGTGWLAFKHPLPDLQLLGLRRYGRTYGGYVGSTPALQTSDVDLIRLVCVKDFNHFTDHYPSPFFDHLFSKTLIALRGEDWKRVRSIVSPTFSSGKLRRMIPIMDECVGNLLDHIQSQIDSGKSEMVLLDVFGSLTMDVIARTAFAVKIRSAQVQDQNNPTSTENAESNVFIKHANKFVKPKMLNLFALMILPRWLCKLFGISLVGKASGEFFTQSITEIIRQRREQNKSSQKLPAVDFLALLCDAADRQSDSKSAAGELPSTDFNSHETAEEREVYRQTIGTTRPGNAKSLDDEEMIAQACIFLVAGYETTNSALTFATYSLATHQDIQERLYGELSALGPDPNYDAIFHCDYLEAVLNESMRLYPGAFMDRVVTQDYRLPAPYQHIKLRAGMNVSLLFYAVHHDPGYWPEPNKFDPERFMPENSHRIVPYSFLPFGVGPRKCVAQRFALMELKLALARLVLKYKFSTTPETVREPLKYKKMIGILRPVQDIILGITSR